MVKDGIDWLGVFGEDFIVLMSGWVVDENSEEYDDFDSDEDLDFGI